MKNTALIVLLCSCILSACGPSQQAIQATEKVGIQETLAVLPTSTFTPSPAAAGTVACVSSDDYRSKVTQYLSLWNAASVDYSNQTAAAQSNNALIKDTAWLAQTNRDLTSIKQAALEVQLLKPPVDWAAVDKEWQAAAANAITMSDDATSGFQTMDLNLLMASVSQTNEFNDHVLAARALMAKAPTETCP